MKVVLLFVCLFFCVLPFDISFAAPSLLQKDRYHLIDDRAARVKQDCSGLVPDISCFEEGFILGKIERAIGNQNHSEKRKKRPSPIEDEDSAVRFVLSGLESYKGKLRLKGRTLRLLRKEDRGDNKPRMILYIPFQHIRRIEFIEWRLLFSRRMPKAKERNYYVPSKVRVRTVDQQLITGFVGPMEWLQFNVLSRNQNMRFFSYFTLSKRHSRLKTRPPVGTLQALVFFEKEDLMSWHETEAQR